MLFTTANFILLFLPITLIGFFALGRHSPRAAAAWLFAASLFFYGYWMPEFTLLLLGSIAGNFVIGRHIAERVHGGDKVSGKRWMIAGVVLNLALLAYFKYANFFVANLDALLGVGWGVGHVILPIGISFYTFTQIAFLADAYQGKVRETNPVHYGLFVTYFPHLVAGPVLHHAQMMPQFGDPAIYRPRADRLLAGGAIFAIGLFKKVVLADGIAPYADAVFKSSDAGLLSGTPEAWLGAIAYTLQLYFDFSGYSDMAIGLSYMFGVRLPFNFNSPYQARNISDFWRRWHISLSTFLRDYLYVPLGGNRHGEMRRQLNLAATMLLGGLWHGAGWTFVVWGGLHGLYLMINHAWRALVGEARMARLGNSRVYATASWTLTLLAVVVAWVFFRAETFGGAGRVLHAMAGFGAPGEVQVQLWNAGLSLHVGAFWCVALGAAALFAPNSNRIGEWLLERFARPLPWRPAVAGATGVVVMSLLLINVARDSVSAFIYFNF